MILAVAATLLGLHDSAANYKEMVRHHVLEVGLDEGSPLVRAIDDILTMDVKI